MSSVPTGLDLDWTGTELGNKLRNYPDLEKSLLQWQSTHSAGPIALYIFHILIIWPSHFKISQILKYSFIVKIMLLKGLLEGPVLISYKQYAEEL